jgi:inosose dehydratase
MTWASRVAAAPISWGVSELGSWGYRISPERVLGEMKAVGFDATELGPPGYLPRDPRACRELLDRHGLRLVAGFLAAVLHESPSAALSEIEAQARMLAAAGAEQLVVAAALPGDTYDGHHELSSEAWRELAMTLTVAENVAAAHGLGLAFHPHAGTAVEAQGQVLRLLEISDVDLCLDTGHLLIGGTDPAGLVAQAGTRIGHVHLKDVDVEIAARVRAREISYADAVRGGLYQPLGQGGLDIDAVLNGLRKAGYGGWFVLEQDTALTADPEPGRGPAEAARQSLDYFRLISGAKQHISASQEE